MAINYCFIQNSCEPEIRFLFSHPTHRPVRAEEGWEPRLEAGTRAKNLCQCFETAQKDAPPQHERIVRAPKKVTVLLRTDVKLEIRFYHPIPRTGPFVLRRGGNPVSKQAPGQRFCANASRRRKKPRLLSTNGLF